VRTTAEMYCGATFVNNVKSSTVCNVYVQWWQVEKWDWDYGIVSGIELFTAEVQHS